MENELLQIKDNHITTSSLKVAEKFHKRHDLVVRAIETLKSDSAKLRNEFFIENTYKTNRGKVYKCYDLTRDGFVLLAMGFTGKEALEWKIKYIEAFNEMEKRLKTPVITDNRLEIARIISRTPVRNVSAIKALYPEYFGTPVDSYSLEHISDINTSYRKWIEDCDINREWLGDFPTSDIYNHYLRFCVDYHLSSMGKKKFYETLENDFNMIKRQRSNGYRYFISA